MEDCDKKKYNGTIKINGKILLNQFFGENGVGDADTVKIGLTSDSIKFRKTRDSTWQENLRLFDTAYYYDEDSGRRKKDPC
jgi:hypothetical protein